MADIQLRNVEKNDCNLILQSHLMVLPDYRVSLHLTTQLHLACDTDLVFICGHMNARVGDLLTDQTEDICIPKKKNY